MTRKEFLELAGKGALASAVGAGLLELQPWAPRPAWAQEILESEEVRRIHAHIDAHLAAHVARIQEHLRQPSVSSWGLGMDECAEQMVGYFREIGCREVERVPTDGYDGIWAYFDAGRGKKTISKYMMYDTQPYVEERWSSPPLAAELVAMPPFGRVVIARGAINSKGPNRAFLNAVESILEITGTLPLSIMFTCDGEEEQGSPHFHQVLEPYIERLKGCSAHLSAGPSQNRAGKVGMYLGNKGILYVECECAGEYWGRGPQRMPIHSSRKAILDSPVWRLIKALDTMVDETGNRILIDGWYDAIRAPNEEEEMLVAELVARHGQDLFASEAENVSAWMNDWGPEQLVRHLCFDTTLNIDGIWAGYTGPGAATILPERAAVKIDSRLVPNQSIAGQKELFLAHLERHGYGDIRVTQLGGGDEWSQTSVREPVVQAVLAVYRHYGIEPAVWPRSAGSSPQAQYTREPLNLPACRGGVGHGGRAHADDEYLVIEGNDVVYGLADMEKSIVDILYTYAHWPE